VDRVEADDIWFDQNVPTPVGRYLYHYTSPATAKLILDGQMLRMGPFSETNDPRETQEWFPSMSVRNGTDINHVDWLRLVREIDQSMRSRVQLSCFTEDRDSGDPQGALWNFHRGWARARMWQQYAGDHAGLCLILDRAQWKKDVDSHPGALNTDPETGFAPLLVHGPVDYEDLPVGSDGESLHYSIEEIEREGASVVASRQARENVNALFLRKNTDWKSECEFRSVAIGLTEPLFVSLVGSLRGIVVGQRCSTDLVDQARLVLASVGRESAIGRCHWQKGAPNVLPV